MTFLAVLPSIHAPSTVGCLDTMGETLLDGLLVVDNTERNLGVAASWNLVALQVLQEVRDWLVVVSAATRFDADGGERFLEALDANPTAWAIQSDDWVEEVGNTVGWHLIGWHRRLLERVGVFDENFWPAYGEDGDWSHRVGVARAEDGWHDAWRTVSSGATITMQGHGVKLAGVTIPSAVNWGYYRAKWGGEPGGREKYQRPFGDPDLPLSWWPTPPDPRSIIENR